MSVARLREWKAPMLAGEICKEYCFVFQNKDRHALRVHDLAAQLSLIIVAPRIGVPDGK